jgi:hypothetical protein
VLRIEEEEKNIQFKKKMDDPEEAVPTTTSPVEQSTKNNNDGDQGDLRQRKTTLAVENNNNDDNDQNKETTPEIAAAKRHNNRNRNRFRNSQPIMMKPGQETTFLNMQIRKQNRAMTGTKSRDRGYEFLFLAIFLVLAFSIGSVYQETDFQNGDPIVSLTLNQVIVIGVWLFVAAFVTSIFKESHFVDLLFYMLVYWPLVFVVATLLFLQYATEEFIWVTFLVLECLTFVVFMGIYYVYPWILNSDWFRSNSRAIKFFKVNLVADYTMTYKRRKSRFGLGTRHTCKYDGSVNERGEPHGLGRWFDDAPDGEVLTGYWQDGVPIAPFSSRVYGTADAFRAVRIPFIKASDDEFSSTKWWPTNEKEVECGIATVECSVSGAFYNELPESQYLIEPCLYNPKTSIGELFSNLPILNEDNAVRSLLIKANDRRGVNIEGFFHAATGKSFQIVDSVVIKVKPEEQKPSRPTLHYMPMTDGRLSFFNLDENVLVRQESEEAATTLQTAKSDIEEGKKTHPLQFHLEVDGWIPSQRKDVLVFFAGFNCPLKQALENFGQLLAMTKLDACVRPILFNWPAGQVLTYHSASRASHSAKNFQRLTQLFQGLQNAGYRNVHLMSHSMGVQTLIGSLVDKKDGSRSDASKCFMLASDCDDDFAKNDENNDGNEDEGGDNSLLICKTITLLNPDFPLVPFQEHAFHSARRLCRTITVVGDKNDGALLFSQVANGIGVRYGYRQPDALLPNDKNKERLSQMLTVGKCVESLYFPEDVVERRGIRKHDYLLFKEKAPIMLMSSDGNIESTKDEILDKAWMDLDVIDTTGLDTNIADIRHSAYNLNPSLLRDLEELVTTSRRAKARSLLYRDGNIFSYCSAPSFVNM